MNQILMSFISQITLSRWGKFDRSKDNIVQYHLAYILANNWRDCFKTLWSQVLFHFKDKNWKTFNVMVKKNDIDLSNEIRFRFGIFRIFFWRKISKNGQSPKQTILKYLGEINFRNLSDCSSLCIPFTVIFYYFICNSDDS